MYIYLINQTPNPTSPHSAHLIRRHSPRQPPPISLLADLIEDTSRPQPPPLLRLQPVPF